MTIATAATPTQTSLQNATSGLKSGDQAALLRGDILLETRPHNFNGGSVTAQMYLPISRSQAWQQLTDYSRWVHYFPDIIHSQVVDSRSLTPTSRNHRLYQVARKAFLMFTAQVEVYLKVFETLHQRIQFRFERGTFADFAADLSLQDYAEGTLLTYSVQATPLIPVPSFLIEQAMSTDLPGNMRTMRRLLCS